MKKVFYGLILVLSVSIFACTPKKAAQTAASDAPKQLQTNMDTPPGVISFKAANQRYSADGSFKRWNFTNVDMKKGKVETLNATAKIDLTSIWEKSPQLTDHLKAPDYFHVEKYTTATLNISNVRAKGGKYLADLTLDMRGMSQKMESEFEVVNKTPLTVKGSAKVNRDLFKVGAGDGVGSMIEVQYETVIQ